MGCTRIASAFFLFCVALFSAFACDDGGSSNASNGSPDGGPTGASPEVVACGRGEACAAGSVCDPYAGCVQCLFDTQCPAGNRCTDRRCEAATACKSDTDCKGTDKVCDLAAGRCVQCQMDVHCPTANHCVERQCKPFEACINSFDCKNGKVCNTGECKDCATHGDCQPGELCTFGKCSRACDGDSDCRDLNQLCDVASAHCVACVSDKDCPDTHHCTEGSCRIDVCDEKSKLRCLDARIFAQCSSNGTAVVGSDCGLGAVCKVTGVAGEYPCQPQICNPGETHCDLEGTKLQTCGADGLAYTSSTACPEGQRCVNDACTVATCTPYARACGGPRRVGVCNANGTGIDSSSECPTGTVCDPTTVECVAATCTVGSKLCKDGIPTECKSGLGYDLGTPCDEDATCVNGECVAKVCTPGKRHCQDGAVFRCGDNGTADLLYDSCPGGVCVEGEGTAECKTKTCTPDALVCEGDWLGKCKPDGTGTVAGSGTDCAASNKACVASACKDVVCTGSQCKGNDVMSCTDKGTALVFNRTCSSGQICLPNSGNATCGSPVCTPNQAACNGNAVATCNATGSGFTSAGTACAANTACVNGTCLPVICTPNQRFCQGGNAYSCGSQGVSSTLYDTCTASEFCSPNSGSAYCAADVCTAGQPTCRGNVAVNCAADGSGPLPAGGTACTATQACEAGACKAVVCPKGETFCGTATQLATCNALGTASSPSSDCATSFHCKDVGTSAACALDICTAGGKACDGEKLATCDANGAGYASSTTNCATTGQICTLAGTCAATVTELTGPEATELLANGSTLSLNRYNVHTARKLTQFEHYLSVTGTSVVTFAVYEGDLSVSDTWPDKTLTKIFERTSTMTGAGWASTGTISVALQANKQYAIGVLMSSGSFQQKTLQTGIVGLSFGRQINGITTTDSSLPSSIPGFTYYGSANVQRLTTTKP